MRPKIFNFPQETLLRLGLNLKEILLLDYIEQFISSGNMRSKKTWWQVVFQTNLQEDNGWLANTRY